ncbi:transmembrane protein 176A-like isoform X2 [Lissotriton helveticus]
MTGVGWIAAESLTMEQAKKEEELDSKADGMYSAVLRVNGLEIASGIAQPTVITINLNQPSGLYSLVEMVKSQWKGKTASPAVPKGEQKVLGAVLIMIGLVCVSMGVLVCFPVRTSMYWSGSCFWTGIPFIVTGAVAVLSERRPSCFSRTAAMFLHLVSFGVAIGGIVMVSGDLSPYEWSRRWSWDLDNLCKTRRDDGYYRRYYETTTPEPYDPRVEECKNVFYNLLAVLNGVKVVVLVFTCLALCISLYSLGSGIKRLCCTRALKKEVKEEHPAPGPDSEPLLAAQPPAYEEKVSGVQTV